MQLLRIILGAGVTEPHLTPSIGRLRVDISEHVLRTVLDLVVAAWPTDAVHSMITTASSEDEITDALCREINAEKARRNIDNLDFHREPQSNLRQDGLPLGYIDVKFVYNFWSRTDYFALECKKVSARLETPGKKYIDDGVVRFVEEKYSPGHSWGGMAGYVIDGDAATCACLIESLLTTHNTTHTAIHETWRRETGLSNYGDLYRTCHRQQRCGKLITILHVLLAFPTKN
jgi:hypothetical protein